MSGRKGKRLEMDKPSHKRQRAKRVREGVSKIRRAAAWARETEFPTNPVTRTLRTTPAFEHDGKMVRNIHRTVDLLCDVLGGLIATQGYRRVLEIGTLFGYSTLHLAEAAALNDGDGRYPRSARPGASMGNRRDDPRHPSRRRAFRHRGGLCGPVRFQVGSSTQVLPRLLLQGRSFDLVFIDGCHDRHTVTLDFINASNLVREGGAIVFDDIGQQMAVSNPDYFGGANSILPALWASNRFHLVPISENTLVAFARQSSKTHTARRRRAPRAGG